MIKEESQEIDKWVNYLTMLFEPYGTYDPALKNIIVEAGNDIAKVTFDLIRSNKENLISEALAKQKTAFEQKSQTKINGDIDFYFGFCAVVGRYVANGTPEEIENLLKGAVRIVR